MENKIVVITGSSSGFGLVMALNFAKNGYTVIATMRNLSNAFIFSTLTQDKRILDNIHPYTLDVTDPQSIMTWKEQMESFSRIDVLVNNAGFALGGFSEEFSYDELLKQFQTNVFGVMEITKTLLPKMRKQKFGKIINISSISGKAGFPGMSAYASSKFALEGYSESLRMELKPFHIDVAIVEPGSYQTNIWDKSIGKVDANIRKNSPYNSYSQSLKTYITENQNKYGNPKDVAKLVYQIAEMKKVKKFRFPIGKGTKLTIIVKQLLPWSLWEKIVLEKLFKKG